MAAEPTSAPGWEEHRPHARLAGWRILVTGAGAGSGHCTAGLFHAEGAAVALLDRDAVAVDAAAAVDWDVAPAVAVPGGLDGPMNCAGASRPGRVEAVDLAVFHRMIEVKPIGAYAVIRACLPHLRAAPWATIVHLASGQGLVPVGPSNAAYAAFKGGLITLTRSLARDRGVDNSASGPPAPCRCHPTRRRCPQLHGGAAALGRDGAPGRRAARLAGAPACNSFVC